MPYRRIDTEIWTDDKFPFASDDAQLIWFHAFTYMHGTPLGIYCASIEALAADKNKNSEWPVERYRKGFTECLGKGFIKYDERFQVVYFPKFFKRNPATGEERNKPSNPNQLIGMLKCWGQIPASELKQELYQTLKILAKAWGEGFVKVMQNVPEPLPNVTTNVPETLAKVSPNSKQEPKAVTVTDSAKVLDYTNQQQRHSSTQPQNDAAAVPHETPKEVDVLREYFVQKGFKRESVFSFAKARMFEDWLAKGVTTNILDKIVLDRLKKQTIHCPSYFIDSVQEFLNVNKTSLIKPEKKTSLHACSGNNCDARLPIYEMVGVGGSYYCPVCEQAAVIEYNKELTNMQQA